MSDGDTTKRLAEIKKRCEKATPGPWRSKNDPSDSCDTCGESILPEAALVVSDATSGGVCVVLTDDREEANAAFIAAARADIPWL